MFINGIVLNQILLAKKFNASLKSQLTTATPTGVQPLQLTHLPRDWLSEKLK